MWADSGLPDLLTGPGIVIDMERPGPGLYGHVMLVGQSDSEDAGKNKPRSRRSVRGRIRRCHTSHGGYIDTHNVRLD